MPVLPAAAARKQIAAGQLAPIYVVVGDDEAEKAAVVAALVETLEPDLRAFNLERFYGGEANPAAVVNACRTLPLMADRRVVIVQRAEKLLEPKRESEESARDLEVLEQYVTAPAPHATLVLIPASIDRRRAIGKALVQRATIVDCTVARIATRSGDEVIDPAWVRKRVSEQGLTIDKAAAELLVRNAGADFQRLKTDVDRLVMFVQPGATITVKDVQETFGPAAAAGGWKLTNCLEARRAGEALRELALLLDEGVAPPLILGQLRSFVERKVAPPQLAAAVDALFRTDLALKTSGGDPQVLLERLVVELCQPLRGL